MSKFKDRVELASVKGNNLVRMVNGFTKVSAYDFGDFLQAVKDSKIFVLYNPTEDIVEMPYNSRADNEVFDSPFDVIYLEREPIFKDGKYTGVTLLEVKFDDPEMSNVSISSMIYDDLNNVFYAHIGFEIKEGVGVEAVVKVLPKDELHNECCLILKNCLNLINTDRAGVESVSEKIRIKRSSGYFTHEINQIIHIKNKKIYKKDTVCSGEKNRIDFSHRFFRRGHWRKADPLTLGKDRHGERNQYGRTWVIESEIGDKSLPLINKIRVVKA